MEQVWKINDFHFRNFQPEVSVNHPQVLQGAFQMEMYGSHCLYISGVQERGPTSIPVCTGQLLACDWSLKLMLSPREVHQLRRDA